MRATLALFLMIPGLGAIAGEIPDPVDWYENEYASLYAEDPGANAEALAGHFAKAMVEHPADGPAVTSDGANGIIEAVGEWLDDGWTHSDLVTLQSDRINDSTALFKAKWRDYYSDGSIDYVCGWYQADYADGKWLITGYADIDCDTHEL